MQLCRQLTAVLTGATLAVSAHCNCVSAVGRLRSHSLPDMSTPQLPAPEQSHQQRSKQQQLLQQQPQHYHKQQQLPAQQQSSQTQQQQQVHPQGQAQSEEAYTLEGPITSLMETLHAARSLLPPPGNSSSPGLQAPTGPSAAPHAQQPPHKQLQHQQPHAPLHSPPASAPAQQVGSHVALARHAPKD